MKRVWLLLCGVLLVAVGAIVWLSVNKKKDAELAARQKVRFQLQWTPQAQFVGFYVAKAKNYYAEEGLQVEFLQGGKDVNPIKNVAENQADIGLATGDQVLVWTDRNSGKGRDPKYDLKALGTVFNESMACFMTKEATKIKTPQDLKGKKIGVFPTYDTEHLLLCLLKKFNLSPTDVTIVDFPSLVQFQDGSVDVYGSYVFNEPIWAEQQNIKVTLLKPADFGIRFYSDTIITRREYYDSNRELLRKFLAASDRGWVYAQQNPKEAVDLMIQEAPGAIGEGMPRMKQDGMCRSAIQHLGAGNKRLNFYMDKARWEEMEASLYGIGKLQGTGHVDSLCDFQIVEEALKR